MSLRRQGVYGDNLPTKETNNVEAASFSIGGIIGQFERKYVSAFQIDDPEKLLEVFGVGISSYYGDDVVKAFFRNTPNISSKLWVKSHVGNDGRAIDAVVANANLNDQISPTLRLEAAYKNNLEYGISGNRTGYKVTNGNRFTTAFRSIALANATSAELDSVIDVKVGDIMKFVLTGGGGATVYKKITAVDEANRTISWTGALHTTATASIDDVATVIGFKLQTYRKTLTGVVTEVEKDLGKQWCTMEPEVTDYYVQNVHSENKWLKISDLSSVSTLQESFPTDASIAYLAGGADGTTPSTAAQWDFNLSALDNKPIRFLANCETTLESVNRNGENYCKDRSDNPRWLYNIPSDRSKSQLLSLGALYQRSDEVHGVICANWLGIDDQFTTSPVAPDREIPNVGHVMGAWIRAIETLGIHYVPAVQEISLLGVNSVVGEQFDDDENRTDLVNSGINLIQKRDGIGIQIRNFVSPSTNTAFIFANGSLMRNFIKVSAVQSLSSSENKPNSFNRIKEDKTALLRFYYNLWERGSTGSVPEGETFGQQDDGTGSSTAPSDHFQVKADAVNNPQSSINLGQRDLDSWFTYPTPAGSIKIGVGILLRSSN